MLAGILFLIICIVVELIIIFLLDKQNTEHEFKILKMQSKIEELERKLKNTL